jgi:hypothetical protein
MKGGKQTLAQASCAIDMRCRNFQSMPMMIEFGDDNRLIEGVSSSSNSALSVFLSLIISFILCKEMYGTSYPTVSLLN